MTGDNEHALARYQRHGFAQTGEVVNRLPDRVRRMRITAKTPDAPAGR